MDAKRYFKSIVAELIWMKPYPLINKGSWNCTFKLKGLIFILNVTSNSQVNHRIKYQRIFEEDYSNFIAIIELLLWEVKRKARVVQRN